MSSLGLKQKTFYQSKKNECILINQSSKESVWNAGDSQETGVQSLGQVPMTMTNKKIKIYSLRKGLCM